MQKLTIHLFGHFQAQLGNTPVSGFKSNKARALLAYLAIDPGHPFARTILTDLLWPDLPGDNANSNLRSVLTNLRKVLEDLSNNTNPLLLIDRWSVQLNPAREIECDAAEFKAQISAGNQEKAVFLYKSRLLEGFFAGSPPFDDWLQMKADAFHQEALQTLNSLATEQIQRGDFSRAIQYTRRQIELEPTSEEAHQQLMYLFALCGQRSAALAQFEQCQKLLAKELSVNPSPETQKLAKAIHDGKTLAAPVIPLSLRKAITSPRKKIQQRFVARDRELLWLETHLNSTLALQGNLLLITGSAGSGKSSLLEAFIAHALKINPLLIPMKGNCTLHGKTGVPYLPFLELTLTLTGSSEPDWMTYEINSQSTNRITEANPWVLKQLEEQAPAIIMMNRAAPPQNDLNEQTDSSSHRQAVLFRQYYSFLKGLSQRYPLVIVLDDLQWADEGSIQLFLYLAQKLAGNPILMIGIFRSEDISAGQDEQQHPLKMIVHELQRAGGEILLDLDQSDGRAFVTSYLNLLPNNFDETFAETLYQHTGGQALFTVELVEELQRTGGLKQNAQGYWTTGGHLDWKKIPVRVEAVIAERISRIPVFWKTVLETASVEGEYFTAEVLMQVMGSNEQIIIQGLSQIVGRQHGLVVPQGVHFINGRRLSYYRFRHSIFQQYLYENLSEAQQAVLHDAVGSALEMLYQGNKSELNNIASRLARHFELAGKYQKAVDYFYLAGCTAYNISAAGEAASYFSHGLKLLRSLPSNPDHAHQELTYLTDLYWASLILYGWGSEECEKVLERAEKLSNHVKNPLEQLSLIAQTANHKLGRGNLKDAIKKSKELIRISKSVDAPGFGVLGQSIIGESYILSNRLAEGCRLVEEALEYQITQPHDPAFLPLIADGKGARVYLSIGLLFLGDVDQARICLEQVLADARLDSSIFLLGFGLSAGGIMEGIILQDTNRVRRYSEDLFSLTEMHNLRLYKHWLWLASCWQAAKSGKAGNELTNILEWANTSQNSPRQTGNPFLLGALAEILLALGRITEGEKIIDGVLNAIDNSDMEPVATADIIRLKGECCFSTRRSRHR